MHPPITRPVTLATALLISVSPLLAHDLPEHYNQVGTHTIENSNSDEVPKTAQAFQPLADQVGISWDDQYIYIESNGLPEHSMMKGITSWQQQVPLPHNFSGTAAFRIPINPVLLDEPAELTLMGPIALAVNGIPIFHSLTQSGKDAKAGGELDEWGGHCGRADDYHYHIAPAHLEATVGKGQPIAYGLDGYPVYMADPAIDKPLDAAHGYFDDDGNYRYVSGDSAPYMMGMFRGAVDLDARPRTDGVRPHLPPLRGAQITDFAGTLTDGYTLTYELDGQPATVAYQATPTGGADFVFTDPDGTVRNAAYEAPSPQSGNKPPQRDEPTRGPDDTRRPPQANSDAPRQPWILVHATELDLDGDTIVTLRELMSETSKVFAAFDTNQDLQLSLTEMEADTKGVRSPLSGFVKKHNLEMDRNNDQSVSREEMAAQFTHFLKRNDLNHDDQLTPNEYAVKSSTK